MIIYCAGMMLGIQTRINEDHTNIKAGLPDQTPFVVGFTFGEQGPIGTSLDLENESVHANLMYNMLVISFLLICMLCLDLYRRNNTAKPEALLFDCRCLVRPSTHVYPPLRPKPVALGMFWIDSKASSRPRGSWPALSDCSRSLISTMMAP